MTPPQLKDRVPMITPSLPPLPLPHDRIAGSIFVGFVGGVLVLVLAVLACWAWL